MFLSLTGLLEATGGERIYIVLVVLKENILFENR